MSAVGRRSTPRYMSAGGPKTQVLGRSKDFDNGKLRGKATAKAHLAQGVNTRTPFRLCRTGSISGYIFDIPSSGTRARLRSQVPGCRFISEIR